MQDLHSTSYLPRARARSPSGRRQPVPDRTLGAQGQRPGGAINPHARKGVSTFGITASRRFFTKPIVFAASSAPLYHFPNFSSKASFSASSLVFPSFMKRRISFSMAS
ncbi:hypothetical protein HMPREF9453_01135 [Dialister succinatiphilus YIT 11850]|uniref:Uncharacterized protein n=1 Tax=Dialister succinatiphilus YIT 11850 TaxID=742743 RepID=H1D0J7_9FIRM|nr:hypothetical protein HMPREF9453_01135 [Dialister succinatiphilus YIT 11850]